MLHKFEDSIGEGDHVLGVIVIHDPASSATGVFLLPLPPQLHFPYSLAQVTTLVMPHLTGVHSATLKLLGGHLRASTRRELQRGHNLLACSADSQGGSCLEQSGWAVHDRSVQGIIASDNTLRHLCDHSSHDAASLGSDARRRPHPGDPSTSWSPGWTCA